MKSLFSKGTIITYLIGLAIFIPLCIHVYGRPYSHGKEMGAALSEGIMFLLLMFAIPIVSIFVNAIYCFEKKKSFLKFLGGYLILILVTLVFANIMLPPSIW